jgi:hypothetical protein
MEYETSFLVISLHDFFIKECPKRLLYFLLVQFVPFALCENTSDQLDHGVFSEHVRKEIFEHAMRAARDSQESGKHDQQEKKAFQIHQNRIRIEL